jgi:hypothetical protein
MCINEHQFIQRMPSLDYIKTLVKHSRRINKGPCLWMEYTSQPLHLCLECSRKLLSSADSVGYHNWSEETCWELLGWQHAQEVSAGFLWETAIGRISVMCFGGVGVIPRCLVQYRSTGWNGHVWWRCGLVLTVNKRLVVERQCWYVAGASLDQWRTRPSVETQWREDWTWSNCDWSTIKVQRSCKNTATHISLRQPWLRRTQTLSKSAQTTLKIKASVVSNLYIPVLSFGSSVDCPYIPTPTLLSTVQNLMPSYALPPNV